jgi:probable phosphoglycerate mutase
MVEGPSGAVCPSTVLRTVPLPIRFADREDARGDPGDGLIVMHGISSRVLRGMLTGAPERPGCGAPVAGPLPQGSVVCIEGGVETVIGLGSGDLGASGTA